MKKGFTLVELLGVMAMLIILMSCLGSAISGARKRAYISRATVDIKEMTNAILAYENYAEGHTLKNKVMTDREATEDSLGFILGDEKGASGENIPILFNASISTDGKIKDPWGRAYRVTIRAVNTSASEADQVAAGTVTTSVFLPNGRRLRQVGGEQ